MKKVIIGSNNPVKLEATKEAFSVSFPDQLFEYRTYAADSRVSEQPFGIAETRTGAKNRSDACRKEYSDADYFVGLEGGLEEIDGQFWSAAWMCVQSKEGKYGYGRTGSFLLPTKVSELIHKGEELGVATDIAFEVVNSKQKGGTIGILTNENITRKNYYREAIIFALIPFLHSELY